MADTIKQYKSEYAAAKADWEEAKKNKDKNAETKAKARMVRAHAAADRIRGNYTKTEVVDGKYKQVNLDATMSEKAASGALDTQTRVANNTLSVPNALANSQANAYQQTANNLLNPQIRPEEVTQKWKEDAQAEFKADEEKRLLEKEAAKKLAAQQAALNKERTNKLGIWGAVQDEYNMSLPGTGTAYANTLSQERKNEIAKGTQNFFQQAPTQAGFMQGVSLNNPINTLEKKLNTDIDTSYAEKNPWYTAGQVAGTMAQFAIPYAGAGGAVTSGVAKALPSLGKMGTKIAGSVATDLAIGLPLNINSAVVKNNLRGTDAAKDIALNTGLDLITGGLMEVIGGVILKNGVKVSSKEDFSKLKPAEQAEVIEKVNSVPNAKDIVKSTPVKQQPATAINTTPKANVSDVMEQGSKSQSQVADIPPQGTKLTSKPVSVISDTSIPNKPLLKDLAVNKNKSLEENWRKQRKAIVEAAKKDMKLAEQYLPTAEQTKEYNSLLKKQNDGVKLTRKELDTIGDYEVYKEISANVINIKEAKLEKLDAWKNKQKAANEKLSKQYDYAEKAAKRQEAGYTDEERLRIKALENITNPTLGDFKTTKQYAKTKNPTPAWETAKHVENELRRTAKSIVGEKVDGSIVNKSDTWKDKTINLNLVKSIKKKIQGADFVDNSQGVGFQYARETQERNIIDVMGKEQGEKAIAEYITPVHKNEAARTRAKNIYRKEIKNLNISTKDTFDITNIQGVPSNKDNEVFIKELKEIMNNKASESALVQLFGEGKISPEDLVSIGADKEKIIKDSKVFRKLYDELIEVVNGTLIGNGYSKAGFTENYFPHFIQNKPDSILEKAAEQLGLSTAVDDLPIDIAGLTDSFKPGKTFNANLLSRVGDKTTYDAVAGFDKYIEGVTDVIFHTDDIKRLRSFENEIRYQHSDSAIRDAIDNINAQELNDGQKQEAIQNLFQDKKAGNLNNFVINLNEYTNILANKKTFADRNMEQMTNRSIYNGLKKVEGNIAKNMISANIASAITNVIPITQGIGWTGKRNWVIGAEQFFENLGKNDGFVNQSTFLTNRRGGDMLIQSGFDKAAKIGLKPMELIDNFSSESLVRAEYNRLMKTGKYEIPKAGEFNQDAIDAADRFAAGLMADRSKGGLPTVFAQKNPASKALTMFQAEVNNQYGYLLKDIPRSDRIGLSKANIYITAAVAAYLYNNLYEYYIGRRPALDPIGIIVDAADKADIAGGSDDSEENKSFGKSLIGISDDYDGDRFKTLDVAGGITKDTLQQVPFIGGLLEGGRIPISAANPHLLKLGKESIKAAGTKDDPETKNFNEKTGAWKRAGDTAFNSAVTALTYLNPLGGGSAIKKAGFGLGDTFSGGKYTVNSKGERVLQYPIEKNAYNFTSAPLLGETTTKYGRDWVKYGFDNLTAQETKGYKAAVKSGVDTDDFMSLKNTFDKLTPIKDKDTDKVLESKPLQIRNLLIADEDLTPEQKSIVDKSFIAYGEKSRLLPDYSGDADNLKISLMPEAAQKRYQFAKKAGITDKQYVSWNEALSKFRKANDNKDPNVIQKYNIAYKELGFDKETTQSLIQSSIYDIKTYELLNGEIPTRLLPEK